MSYVISVGSTTIANRQVSKIPLWYSGINVFERFIQDIMLIDDELPMALVNTTTCKPLFFFSSYTSARLECIRLILLHIKALFGACAETVIILISSKYIAVSVPILIGVLWIIQMYYLKTSKQLRLMDIEAKAPLSAFVLETVQGIVSVRAFDRAGEFSLRTTSHLDYSQRAMYMLLSVQVWLKMILDFVVALLAILVTTLAVVFRSSQSLGFLGLALVNLVSLLDRL